ncbi:MAG: iron permease [Peptococcaceae bacterium BICA1-8]|nr:MAG: iron permease [Peptococcaceae bacterium BICA1-8]
MLAGILITLREGLEAFLIVGILLGYLTKMGQKKYQWYVWLGTGLAILLSVALTWAFNFFSFQFEGANALLFEIVISLIAVGVLTYMVLWMQEQSKHIKSDLETKMQEALTSNKLFAIVGLAFVSVLREGLETALFLTALVGSAGEGGLLSGAMIGFLIAALLSYVFFRSAVRLDLRKFFIVTGSLLIFIAAGLIGHALLGSHELGIIPPIISEVWNINGIINEDGVVGRILHAFVGYDGNPSLMWVVGYFGYIYIFGRKFLQQLEYPKKKAKKAMVSRG